jgi:hypothetical protein
MDARFTIIADAFALATTAKTACNVIASATANATIVEIGASVDQGTGRCLVELFESTQATAGTVGSSTGAKQLGGYAAGTDGTPACTYGREYSAEPTVLTVLKSWWFPCPGPLVIQFPLGREPKTLLSGSTNHKAIGIRLKVDTGTPTCEAYLEWEE